MRALHREGSGVAREDRGAGVKIERPVDVGKALEQPTAEEAGAARNENVLVPRLLPERFCLAENVVEIVGGQRLLCHSLNLTILADVDIV